MPLRSNEPTSRSSFDRPLSSLKVAAELAALDQAARLTLRLAEGINVVSLRFSERQRLARILLRLAKIAGEAHDILPQIPSQHSSDRS